MIVEDRFVKLAEGLKQLPEINRLSPDGHGHEKIFPEPKRILSRLI
jgi:hypothetical protein